MAIIYGVHGKIELFLPSSHSLKDRRRVINSLKTRLHTHYNMSVADISDDQIWQRGMLSFALVSSSFQGLQDTLAIVDRFLGDQPECEVILFDYRYLPAGDD